MAFQLQLGVSKKIGLPHFGSLGASCQLQLELDGSLFQPERLESFHQQVAGLYATCTQAVEQQLRREPFSRSLSLPDVPPHGASTSEAPVESTANGSRKCLERSASERQLDYAEQLANECDDAGLDLVEALARARFSKSPAELSTVEASRLIRILRALRTGEVDLPSLLTPED